MKLTKYIHLLFVLLILSACNKVKNDKNEVTQISSEKNEFIIAFGSCNNQVLHNPYWNSILEEKPNVWIWGGDVIYSDTDDMTYLQKNYELQNANPDYKNFKASVEILGTWDDHDYGMNDGGEHYEQKQASQQLFLDFLEVPKESPRRQQEGVYFQKDYQINKNSIVKVITLDSRYFRSDLVKDTISKKRYFSAKGGTMLGETQWKWLEETLKNSEAEFNIIMTSVQFLSNEHGFEAWGNMPDEVAKMEQLLVNSKAKNVIILSGDRHISEFSKKDVPNLTYPLIDFTSSGMTHSYSGFKGEPNKYRVGEVVSETSYGLITLDLEQHTAHFKIKGKEETVLESMVQNYGSNE